MNEVPHMRTVEDRVLCLRQALGWLLDVHARCEAPEALRDAVNAERATMFAEGVFNATNPNGDVPA